MKLEFSGNDAVVGGIIVAILVYLYALDKQRRQRMQGDVIWTRTPEGQVTSNQYGVTLRSLN